MKRGRRCSAAQINVQKHWNARTGGFDFLIRGQEKEEEKREEKKRKDW